MVARFPERVEYLTTQRGLTLDTIEKFKLGHDGQRFTIPVRYRGKWVAVKRYLPGGNPKMLNLDGHGAAVLAFTEVLAGNTLPVLLCEGEWDALLANQKGDGRFVAITGTGGALTIPAGLSLLAPREVFIAYDCDDFGVRGAQKIAERLRKAGSRVYILDLTQFGLPRTKDHGADISDFFMKHGGTAEQIVAEMDRARNGDDFDPVAEFKSAVADRAYDLRVSEAARQQVASERAAEIAARDHRVRSMLGDQFALDLPPALPALIGSGSEALAVDGEATVPAGGDGVGKSSLNQQIALARIGLRRDFLGLAVAPAAGRVLYLAMDRPQQIRRSLGRMVSEADRAVLRERFVTWSGPLPIDPLGSPQNLADWIRDEFGDDISDVFVDSYKDLAPGLAEDKPGAQLNLAMQEVLARGIQWFGIHHQRKPAADRTADYGLADVYGSRWLTAGAGSVIMVLGDAGDATVELRHVKQPASVVGPLLVKHDHSRGVSSRVVANMSVAGLLMEREGQRWTVRQLAQEMFGEFSDGHRKRIERDLRRLASDPANGVHTESGKRGGSAGSTPAEWWFEPQNRVQKTSETNGRAQRSGVAE
jgi:hypothetical protein